MTDQQSDAVPRGVPASDFGSPFVDLIAADPPPAIRSVTSDLLDEMLSAPRDYRTRQKAWIEDSSPAGGHWERVR